MEAEDKILLYRAIIGIIAGIISAFTNTVFIAIIPIIVGYVISVGINYYIFSSVKLRTLLTKGTLIMVVVWFLMVIILYNTLVE